MIHNHEVDGSSPSLATAPWAFFNTLLEILRIRSGYLFFFILPTSKTPVFSTSRFEAAAPCPLLRLPTSDFHARLLSIQSPSQSGASPKKKLHHEGTDPAEVGEISTSDSHASTTFINEPHTKRQLRQKETEETRLAARLLGSQNRQAARC